MTITQFSELIVEMLGENNHDKIDDRVVLAMADSFRGAILGEMGDSITGEYIKVFEADVKQDFRGKYIDLPCELCPVPNNGAYRFVGTDEENSFIPLKPNSVSSMSNLEVGNLAGKTGFIPEGKKVRFRYFPVPPPSSITLKVIPNLFWLYENASDDELMGSADVEAKLLQMCFDSLKVKAQVPEDKDNSNKTNP